MFFFFLLLFQFTAAVAADDVSLQDLCSHSISHQSRPCSVGSSHEADSSREGGGCTVVGGALTGSDSAPAAAYRERWRGIISSATCGRRLLERDHPAAPGHSVVNLMVGRQGRLGLHCRAKIT